MAGNPVTAAVLRAIGEHAGLHSVGFADAAPFVDTRTALFERRDAGLSDTMQFTYRNPDRSTDPEATLPTARSLVVAAQSYPARTTTSPVPTHQRGHIAAYAWRDHYADLRVGLDAMADVLRSAGWVARVVADDNAMVDRAAAVRAGLGWFGKNSNVLLPRAGSFFVLGSVVTDALLESDEPLTTDCGTCVRCIDGCPTAAIVAPGVIDARRCLAWLVQKPGVFPREFREALGTRIYGCDDCQEVCPPSRNHAGAEVTDVPVALTGRPSDVVGATVDLEELLTLSDDVIEARHGRWYIPDRDMNHVRRNALLAYANAAVDGPPAERDRAVAAITPWLSHDDANLRAHAVWAVGRLGVAEAAQVLADDPHPDVQDELARLASP